MKKLLNAGLRRTALLSLALFLLIVALWKISRGLEQQMDIRFYDESYYLTQGFFHPVSRWTADYSPLYSLSYKLLGFFTGDEIGLYYLAYRFWDLVLGLSIFWMLRLAGIGIFPALVWALSALASQLGLPLWPKAGHLALAGCSLGIAGLWHWRGRPATQLAWTASLCLLLAWCRPEFIAGAAAAGFTFLILFILTKEKPVVTSLIPLIFCLGFALVWGLPFGQSGRGLVAFGQHFVHNWRNISGQNSGDLMWDWVNWRPIFREHFGNARNPWQALLENPGDMLRHLWFNLRYLPYNCLVFFTETLAPKRMYGISPLAGFGMVWLLAEAGNRFELAGQLAGKIRSKSLPDFLPWFCLAIPSLLAGLLFQPRPHYILPLLPFFIFMSGHFFRPALEKANRNRRFVWLSLPLLVFLLLPGTEAFFVLEKGSSKALAETHPQEGDPFQVISSRDLSHIRLVRELQRFPFPQGFRIFDASTGASEYLGTRLVQCGKTGFEMNYPALEHFGRFLDSAQVQGILLHETIRYDRFFSGNAAWNELKSQPQKLGWLKVAIGNSGDSLLLRK